MERVDRSEFGGLFVLDYLLSRLDDDRVFLLVAFLADHPPHRTSIIKVFENTKVPSDTCPDQFNPVVDQRVENPR